MAGRQTVFLAGARQKAEGLNPCSPDRDIRKKAVASLGECFHFARQAGASAVMLSSGARPDDERDDNECFSLLADSLACLHRLEPDLPILLEPGDRDVEYRHLVGPTARAVEFTAACRKDGIPLGLIFDMSHAAQLGEALGTAWNQAEPFCSHVHFANCILDKNSPLYGDKHPFFEVPGGVYTHQDARDFLALLQKSPKTFTISLEMICPAGEDEERFFDHLTRIHPWFFEQ
jgi:sugar phosphate isomerase/epimerase